MSLRHQIVALAIVPLILAILAITAFITWQSAQLATSSIDTFEQSMLKSKEGEILNLTKLAVSSINEIYQNASADDEAAKEKVKAIFAALDYGPDGYFFVYDYDGNNIVHPRQGFRPGHNWLDLVDPDGDKVIASLIDAAKAGGGLHQYKWQRPSTEQVADKLSFVVALDKWRWVLGTGVYLDEVYARTAAAKADLRANIRKTFIVVASIAIPAVLLVFAAGMMLTLHERRMADGKLKQLTQRVIDAQEEERTRLARELHDGISQNLVGVRYAMDLANRKIADGPEAAGAAIGQSIEALNVAIKEVRRLSHDLRPRVLDDLGLKPALDALCQNFAERSGIAVHFEASAFTDDLKPGASTALYRVTQEALNNAERHSGATDITITLWTKNGRARMTIADNGKGFESDRSERGGLGLRNMQERIAHFKGVLLVKTSPQGTTLTAMLPRSAAVQSAKEAQAA